MTYRIAFCCRVRNEGNLQIFKIKSLKDNNLSPETTTGGRALKFYASVRIDVRKIETLKKSGEVVGVRTRAKIVKNKVAPPFTEAEFDVMFGKGIDTNGEILDIGANLGIVVKSGAWYALEDGTKIGQGRDNAKEWLETNPDKREELKAKVQAALSNVEDTEGIIDRALEDPADEDFD